MSYGFTVVINGNLGRDPETKTVGQNNTKMVTFSVAVKVGRDDVEWVQVNVFGREADFAETYLHKGSGVVITGSGTINRYQGRDGKERASLNVRAYSVDFASGGRENRDESPQHRQQSYSNEPF